METTRTLTLPERLVILFSGFEAMFGWIFFGFGMIFFWIFGMASPLPDMFVRYDATTKGLIQNESATSYSVNDNNVEEYTFSYEVDGVPYQGSGYIESSSLSLGDTVEVHYQSDYPAKSRVNGLRSAPFSWVVLFVLIFPLVGLGFIVFSFRKNYKHLDLLLQGIFAQGKRLKKEPTNVTINDQMVYKYTFEFTANDGRKYEATGNTHLTHLLEDEVTERILYAPADPNYSAVYDTIANAPTLGPDGNFNPLPLTRYLVLIIPTISIVVHGYIAFILLKLL